MDVARVDAPQPPLEYTVTGAEIADEREATAEAEAQPAAQEPEPVEDPDRGQAVDLEA